MVVSEIIRCFFVVGIVVGCIYSNISLREKFLFGCGVFLEKKDGATELEPKIVIFFCLGNT